MSWKSLKRLLMLRLSNILVGLLSFTWLSSADLEALTFTVVQTPYHRNNCFYFHVNTVNVLQMHPESLMYNCDPKQKKILKLADTSGRSQEDLLLYVWTL